MFTNIWANFILPPVLQDCFKQFTLEERDLPRAIPKHIFITVIEWGWVSKADPATSFSTSTILVVKSILPGIGTLSLSLTPS